MRTIRPMANLPVVSERDTREWWEMFLGNLDGGGDLDYGR